MNVYNILTNKSKLEQFNAIDYECLPNNILFSLIIGDLEWRYWIKLVHIHLVNSIGEDNKITRNRFDKEMEYVKKVIFKIDNKYKKLKKVDFNDRENAWIEIEEILSRN